MSEENIEADRHFLETVWDRRDFEAARQIADTKPRIGLVGVESAVRGQSEWL